MPYRDATTSDRSFFADHGWLVVEDVIDPSDLAEFTYRCDEILEQRDTMARDWAWSEGVPFERREFKIVQASPTIYWPELSKSPLRTWVVRFASSLMGRPVEFWYDQFLAKPPQRSSATYWHQDEGYWGRNLDERGITCWMPFHDVDPTNGCMHFIDGGHRDGVIEHRRAPGVQSDLLYCQPDESRQVACPIRVGSVTFHHGKTPHFTPANLSQSWRKALTQHLKVVGAAGEGDHYPWKVHVEQVRMRPRQSPSSEPSIPGRL